MGVNAVAFAPARWRVTTSGLFVWTLIAWCLVAVAPVALASYDLGPIVVSGESIGPADPAEAIVIEALPAERIGLTTRLGGIASVVSPAMRILIVVVLLGTWRRKDLLAIAG